MVIGEERAQRSKRKGAASERAYAGERDEPQKRTRPQERTGRGLARVEAGRLGQMLRMRCAPLTRRAVVVERVMVLERGHVEKNPNRGERRGQRRQRQDRAAQQEGTDKNSVLGIP